MNGTSNDFDVIVIGGGAAGAATAIECRRHRLRTLLLETLQSPRQIPGETLPAGAEPLFRSLGVGPRVELARFLRQPGHLVRREGHSTLVRFGSDERGPWLGYQADRVKLKSILLDSAVDCGVTIIRLQPGLRPLMSNGVVAGVLTPNRIYSAAFVVDATGQSRWLQRWLKLPVRQVSPLLTAYYGWADCAADLIRSQRLAEFNVEDHGWTWIAPVQRHRFAWVRLNIHGARGKNPFLPPAIPGTVPAGRSLARDVTWKIVPHCADCGYFLVGDAACVLDPACSHGVMRAMMSGMLAAEAIGKIIANQVPQPSGQAGYRSWVAQSFCRDAAGLLSLYAKADNPPSWLASAAAMVRYMSNNSSA